MVIRCGKVDFLEEYLNSHQKRLGFNFISVGREVKKLLRALILQLNRIYFVCTQKIYIYSKIIRINFYIKENGAGELE